MVESGSDDILNFAKDSDVAFLVVGDPFGATTHSDLRLRAHRMGIVVEVIHNASIMNAVACCGLQLYRFGQAVSVCFWTERWKPDSYYDKILENRKMGLHTLCLLDIKVKEPSEANLFKGKGHIFEPPRFMTINEAVDQLLQIRDKRNSDPMLLTEDDFAIGLARVGSTDQVIKYGNLRELLHFNFGPPLHCLLIPANLHDVEREVLEEIYSLTPFFIN
jgi:diphthine methyl ester synthase